MERDRIKENKVPEASIEDWRDQREFCRNCERKEEQPDPSEKDKQEDQKILWGKQDPDYRHLHVIERVKRAVEFCDHYEEHRIDPVAEEEVRPDPEAR